jgi:nicotinic acid mononucleotide adenylyltransferase
MKKRERRMVDFGYQEKPDTRGERGTLCVLDSFDETTLGDVEKMLAIAEGRAFQKVVFFPHNEKTLRSMGLKAVSPFHQRVRRLEELIEEARSPVTAVVDVWEEKRKKYTPLELIVRYFEETYPGPFFLYLNDGYANACAGFASFAEIIRKVRLLINPVHEVRMHPQLMNYQHRWEKV